MFSKRLLIVISFLLLITTSAIAGGNGRSAVDFLNIGVSARAAATGGAFGAIADGPMSSYYNPAGLSQSESYQIAGMHSEWLQDLRYEYLGYSMPVGTNGGFGLSFVYLSMGEINGYDANNNYTGTIPAYDMATVVSYGHSLNENLSVGASGKWISEKLDNFSTSGFAGDIGLQFRTYNYKFGLSVMNIGPKINYENSSSPLPTTVTTGVAYYPFGSNLSFLLGSTTPIDGRTSFKTGVEYNYLGLMMFRAGYDSEANYGDQNGFSMGGGLMVSGQNLDYAYNLNDMMGATHQISFVFKFGETRPVNHPSQPSVTNYNKAVITKSVVKNEISTGDDLLDTFEDKEEVKKENEEVLKYLVIAARYNRESDAAKHAATLNKLGLKAKSFEAGENEYYVVIKEAKNMKKAKKEKSKREKDGINCEIVPFKVVVESD